GAAYRLPSVLGTTCIVLCDPKAIAHFYAKETTTYILTPLANFLSDTMYTNGLYHLLLSPSTLIANCLRSLRESPNPALSVAAVRKLLPIFYDSAHKARVDWDDLQDSPDGVAIDIQEW
ncbi:hypothetical protein HD554DRAFT_2000093, partial [Boletus coccyginus]